MKNKKNQNQPRSLTESEIIKKKRLLDHYQKLKEIGFIKHGLKQSFGMSLGFFLAGLLLKKSVLYLIVVFPLTFLFVFIKISFLWPKLNEKIKTLTDELNKGVGIVVPLLPRVRFFIGLLILLLLLKPALSLLMTKVNFYKIFTSGKDHVELTIDHLDKKKSEISVPIEYLGLNISASSSDIYPMLKPLNSLLIIASYPEFQKLVIEGEMLEVMKSLSATDGWESKYQISNVLNLYPNYLGVVVGSPLSLNKNSITATYDRFFKDGLDSAQQSDRVDLTIFEGKYNSPKMMRGKVYNFIGDGGKAYLVKDRDVMMICRSYCVMSFNQKDGFGINVFFHPSKIDEWKPILELVDSKISEFEKPKVQTGR